MKKAAYRVLGQDRGKVRQIGPDGRTEWEYDCRFVSHDIERLKNGNTLVHVGPATVREVTMGGETVWEYTAKPVAPYSGAVEVHAFRRLKNGDTMVSETGNKRIVEVRKDGTIAHEVPLTINNPNSHRDTRMVRPVGRGGYLVCHEGDGMVREYDRSGKVVWSYAMELGGRPRTPNHDGHGNEVFGAVRLKNGNTLIAGGNNNRVLEVNKSGAIVWSVDQKELPGVTFYWVTTLQVLPNGNIIVGNTHGGENNPQLVEVSRDKKVAWSFYDWQRFGNDMCAAQCLDLRGDIIR